VARIAKFSPRLRAAVGAVIAIVAILAINAWWLDHFRRGYPLDTDESGYMGIAFSYTAAWHAGGISSLWQAFAAQVSQAPLVPLLTVPIALVHEGMLPSFGVELAFLALLGLASYGIGASFGGPSYGLLAVIGVLSVPGVIDFSREYIFALPATAVFAAALWALIRSDSLASTPWAVAFGALLGACVLTRTMMIGLLPGALVPAILQVALRSEGRKRALVNLALAVAAGCGLAAVWLANSWSTVINYLTTAGYGAQAAQFGRSQTIATIVVELYLYLPLTLLLGSFLLVGALSQIARLRTRAQTDASARMLSGTELLAQARALVSSAWFPLLVVVLEGWAALQSTRNAGFGFELPLVPPLVLLALWAVFNAPSTWLRRALLGCLVGVSALNLVSKADVSNALSRPAYATVPILGAVPVIDGESLQSGTLRADGYRLGPPTQRWPASLRLWDHADRVAAQRLISIAAAHGRGPVVFLGSRNPLFNTNSISLAGQLCCRVAIPFGQLDPTIGGDTVASYRQQLSDPARGQPNLLVLSDPSPGEYRPTISQAKAARAAVELGFRRVASEVLPDRRRATVWWLKRGPVVAKATG
jgi:4-amino-4-deoxy-L-arabinose transferase-like glycosyltransferase